MLLKKLNKKESGRIKDPVELPIALFEILKRKWDAPIDPEGVSTGCEVDITLVNSQSDKKSQAKAMKHVPNEHRQRLWLNPSPQQVQWNHCTTKIKQKIMDMFDYPHCVSSGVARPGLTRTCAHHQLRNSHMIL